MSSARHAEIDSVLNELRKQRLNDEKIHSLEQKRLNQILLFCQRINEQTSINSNGNNLKDQTQQDGEQSEEEQSYSFEDNLIEDDSIATQNTNDSSSKNSFDFLNELKLEEALIQGEIDELTNKQNHNENNDDEDEDLKEFKRIENEIKISELNKSLEAIKNEIKKSKKADTNSNTNAPLAQTECLTDEQSNSGTIGSSNQLVKRRINERRPLTLYLPISDDQLDLIHHITTLGHDIASNDSVTITAFTCSGFLFKLCSNSSISKWRKRYFYFDRQNQMFVYYRNKKYYRKGKISGGVHFDEIHNVYVDHNRINENHKKRNVFIVATTPRQFVLSTFSPETMRIWIDVVFTGAQAYQQF